MSAIREVKQRIGIVELVSEYVALQKSGRNLKGLCPFHSEKHASFFVFPEQQIWHCFGACGTGGDVLSFVMKKEGVEFGEALRLLADKAGISLKPREGRERAAAEESDSLFEINEAATEYYHHLLLSAKVGEAARSYVARRGVTPETVKVFRLGFSPDSWDAMKGYLLGKGYTEKMIMGAGLTVEKEGGGSYDRFRDRLMFPICDVQGRVAGFGARALDDSLPKYMNSPQTLVFDKSSILYGIDKARSAIRKRGSVIIVEGYTDAITAYQNGWQNVVASMGTSLTGKQVGSLKGLTKNIILALDADLAGEEATLRGRAVLAHSNAEAEVILLPSGKDPDEVIGENPALWEKLVEKAMPVMDFAFQSVLGKIDVDRARDKSLAIQKLVPLIYEMSDLTQRFHYVDKLARSLKMGRSDVEAACIGRGRWTRSLGLLGQWSSLLRRGLCPAQSRSTAWHFSLSIRNSASWQESFQASTFSIQKIVKCSMGGDTRRMSQCFRADLTTVLPSIYVILLTGFFRRVLGRTRGSAALS